MTVRSTPVPPLFPKTHRDLPALQSQLEQPASSGWRGENSPAFHSRCIRALSPTMANFQPFSSVLEFMNAKAASPQTGPSCVFRHSQVCQPWDSTPVRKSYTHFNSKNRSSWQSCQVQHPRETQLERSHIAVPTVPTSHTLLGCQALGPLPNCCALSKKYQVT